MPAATVTLEDAIALSPYPVHHVGLRDLGAWWWVPHAQIGSLGILVAKQDGRVVEAGSGMPLEGWLWAIEHDLVDDVTATLTVVEVFDVGLAADLLRSCRLWAPPALSVALATPPVSFEVEASWLLAVRLWRRADDAFRFVIERTAESPVPGGPRLAPWG